MSNLFAMLQATYEPVPGRAREWGFWGEVTVGERRFDAIAVNLWRSRGWTVRGHEVKESRADWLAERRDPGKADAGYRRCDEWYLVAAEGVVLDVDAELPRGWGLMVPARTRVKIVRAATAHAAEYDRTFWMRLISRAIEDAARVSHEMRTQIENAARAEARADATRDAARNTEGLTNRQRLLVALGERLERILGKKADGTGEDDWEADPLYAADDQEVRRAARLARGILQGERDAKARLDRSGISRGTS